MGSHGHRAPAPLLSPIRRKPSCFTTAQSRLTTNPAPLKQRAQPLMTHQGHLGLHRLQLASTLNMWYDASLSCVLCLALPCLSSQWLTVTRCLLDSSLLQFSCIVTSCFKTVRHEIDWFETVKMYKLLSLPLPSLSIIYVNSCYSGTGRRARRQQMLTANVSFSCALPLYLFYYIWNFSDENARLWFSKECNQWEYYRYKPLKTYKSGFFSPFWNWSFEMCYSVIAWNFET